MIDTAEQPCGETPASDVAAGERTREEGGVPPLMEWSATTRWLTPTEAAEAETAEAQAGTI